MAVVGHWNALSDAQELTQSMLLKGVVRTVIESGHLVPMMPIKQITGKDILYNREDSWTASDGADFAAIRQQLSWSSAVTYTPVTVALKRIYRQDPLDNFVMDTYGNINDYRSVAIEQLTKRLVRFLEDRTIYGDLTYPLATEEFDGLHALAQENSGNLDIDEGEGALSLMNLRKAITAMKVNTLGKANMVILVPPAIGDRIDAGYAESGLVRTNVTHQMLQATIPGVGQAGQEITFFRGVPIVRSDFLVAEQANTGVGSNARAKNSSGTAQYSVFIVRFGQTEDGGLSMGVGGGERGVDGMFRRTHYDKLEDYDSEGERLTTYMAPLLGAGNSLARIYDITDAEVTP